MEQHTCTVSPFIIALFSVIDWFVNIFPIAIQDHSMLCNLACTAQTGNNARGCKEKLNLNRVFYRSNGLSLQLNRPLRNTRITFAFCFGYFSIDAEKLSSKKNLSKKQLLNRVLLL